MTANRDIWVIEEKNGESITELRRDENGLFIIWWAGCEFPPQATLEEVCSGDLLDQCRAALLRAPDTQCDHIEFDTPLGDSFGVDLRAY